MKESGKGKITKFLEITKTNKTIKIADIITTNSLSAVPGTAEIYTLTKLIASSLRDYLLDRTELKIQEFHRKLLLNKDESIDSSVLDSTIELADYHALLQACLADIEDEKTAIYANLAKAIVRNDIQKNLRRHLIISLKEITWDQLDVLARTYVLSKNSIMPSTGAGRREAKEVIAPTDDYSAHGIDCAALKQKHFINENEITPLGTQFIEACYPKDLLEPSAFEYKKWSGYRYTFFNFDGHSQPSNSIYKKIESYFREMRIEGGLGPMEGALERYQPILNSHFFLIGYTNGKQLSPNRLKNLQDMTIHRPVLQIIYLAQESETIKPILETDYITTTELSENLGELAYEKVDQMISEQQQKNEKKV